MLANSKGRYALPYFQNLFEDFVFAMTLSQVIFYIGLDYIHFARWCFLNHCRNSRKVQMQMLHLKVLIILFNLKIFCLFYSNMLIQSWSWEVLLIIWFWYVWCWLPRILLRHLLAHGDTYPLNDSSIRFKQSIYWMLPYSDTVYSVFGIYTMEWWIQFYPSTATKEFTIQFSIQLPVDLDFRFYAKITQE